jgi:mono/diheme cytochrome c family protein
MPLLGLTKRRVVGGITVVAMSSGLWLASSALADGPPTPNPLSPTPNPMVSQLSPQLQALETIGTVPVAGENITGAGPASGIIGDATAGAVKFKANCAICHGNSGIGGIDNPGSNDGTVPPVNPIDPGFIADASGDPAIFAHDLDLFLQHGSRPAGNAPLLSMPAWGDHGLLSQKDIADVEAYVMALNGVSWPNRCPGPRLELANPSPGSRVEAGSLVVQGRAVDIRASKGSGIDRIEFFLEDRDAGGIFVGTATPSQTIFQATVSLPASIGAHNLFAYARSAVTGRESVVSIPIALGEDPSSAFATVPAAIGQNVNCAF